MNGYSGYGSLPWDLTGRAMSPKQFEEWCAAREQQRKADEQKEAKA